MSRNKDTGWRNSAMNPGTQWRTIAGMITTEKFMRVQSITVRITKDDHGMGLSLSDDRTTQIYIPLEPIADKLREVLQEDAKQWQNSTKHKSK